TPPEERRQTSEHDRDDRVCAAGQIGIRRAGADSLDAEDDCGRTENVAKARNEAEGAERVADERGRVLRGNQALGRGQRLHGRLHQSPMWRMSSVANSLHLTSV